MSSHCVQTGPSGPHSWEPFEPQPLCLERAHLKESWAVNYGGADGTCTPLQLISPARRLVRLEKGREEDFGARLGRFGGKTYVVFVSECPMIGVNLSKECLPVRTPRSPAYRTGLRFGDEIVSINHSSATALGVRAAEEYLRKHSTLLLEIAEAPLEQVHHLHPKASGSQKLGVLYAESTFQEVTQDSLGHHAGLAKGRSVVSVNGACVLGKGDDQVSRMLRKAMEERKPFTIATVPTKAYLCLLGGINTYVAVLRCCCSLSNVTAAMLVDCDFTASRLQIANRRVSAGRERASKSLQGHDPGKDCGSSAPLARQQKPGRRQVWYVDAATKSLRLLKMIALLQTARASKCHSLDPFVQCYKID